MIPASKGRLGGSHGASLIPRPRSGGKERMRPRECSEKTARFTGETSHTDSTEAMFQRYQSKEQQPTLSKDGREFAERFPPRDPFWSFINSLRERRILSSH